MRIVEQHQPAPVDMPADQIDHEGCHALAVLATIVVRGQEMPRAIARGIAAKGTDRLTGQLAHPRKDFGGVEIIDQTVDQPAPRLSGYRIGCDPDRIVHEAKGVLVSGAGELFQRRALGRRKPGQGGGIQLALGSALSPGQRPFTALRQFLSESRRRILGQGGFDPDTAQGSEFGPQTRQIVGVDLQREVQP